MPLSLRFGLALAGTLALGNLANAQQSVPFCQSEKRFGEWKVLAQTTTGLISLPSNLLEPRTSDAFGDSGSFGREDNGLRVNQRRPGGSIKNLPPSGTAILRFSYSSEALEFQAPFSLRSYPGAGQWAASDSVSIEVKKPGARLGLIDYFLRAEKRKARVELTAQAGNTTFIKYAFATSGFGAALQWLDAERKSLAALQRENKCRIPSLF